jgi:hypothetical protein
MFARCCVILTSVFVLGCAGPGLPPVAAGHPASPEAPESPVPARSSILDVERADPVPPVAAQPAAEGTSGEHATHGAEASGPSSSHEGHGPPENAPAATQTEQEAMYVCPMHQEVTSSKPGKCPKCFMRLRKQEAGHGEHP